MANECLPQVQACGIRVARLGLDGAPTVGASNMYVSDSLLSLAFAWVSEDGEEIVERNACGTRIVDYKEPDELRRGRVTINLLVPDPELSELLSGETVLTNTADVGGAAPALGQVPDAPVSLELWAKRILNKKVHPTKPYAWWVYPFITNLRPADHEHARANLARSFVGDAYENTLWGNGPNNDWPAGVASDKVYQWLPTATKPTASCGYVALPAQT